MSDRKTIVFDCVCVLCSTRVRFVLSRDRREEFSFAAIRNRCRVFGHREICFLPAAPEADRFLP